MNATIVVITKISKKESIMKRMLACIALLLFIGSFAYAFGPETPPLPTDFGPETPPLPTLAFGPETPPLPTDFGPETPPLPTLA